MWQRNVWILLIVISARLLLHGQTAYSLVHNSHHIIVSAPLIRNWPRVLPETTPLQTLWIGYRRTAGGATALCHTAVECRRRGIANKAAQVTKTSMARHGEGLPSRNPIATILASAKRKIMLAIKAIQRLTICFSKEGKASWICSREYNR